MKSQFARTETGGPGVTGRINDLGRQTAPAETRANPSSERCETDQLIDHAIHHVKEAGCQSAPEIEKALAQLRSELAFQKTVICKVQEHQSLLGEIQRLRSELAEVTRIVQDALSRPEPPESFNSMGELQEWFKPEEEIFERAKAFLARTKEERP